MGDRDTLINFYLMVIGALGAGLLLVLGGLSSRMNCVRPFSFLAVSEGDAYVLNTNPAR